MVSCNWEPIGKVSKRNTIWLYGLEFDMAELVCTKLNEGWGPQSSSGVSNST